MSQQALFKELENNQALCASLEKQFNKLDLEIRTQERAFVAHATIKEQQSQRRVKKGKEAMLKNLQEQQKQAGIRSERIIGDLKRKIEDLNTAYSAEVVTIQQRYTERRRQLDEEERRALQQVKNDLDDKVRRLDSRIETQRTHHDEKDETYFGPQIAALYEDVPVVPQNEVVPAFTRTFLEKKEERDNLGRQVALLKVTIESLQKQIVQTHTPSATQQPKSLAAQAAEVMMEQERRAREYRRAAEKARLEQQAAASRAAQEAEEVAAATAHKESIKTEANENKRRNMLRWLEEKEGHMFLLNKRLQKGYIDAEEDDSEPLPLTEAVKKDYRRILETTQKEVDYKRRLYKENFGEDAPPFQEPVSEPPSPPSEKKRVIKLKK